MIKMKKMIDNTMRSILNGTVQNRLRHHTALLLLMLATGTSSAFAQGISSLSDITDPLGSYTLSSSFSTTGTAKDSNDDPIGTSTNPFKGTIDGQLVTITGDWNKPLFDYVEDAVIKNVIIDSASVSGSACVGAIAGTAQGASRIYNCGILGGTVKSTGGATDNPKSANACGGLVGLLQGTSRVINCYSYADITGGNRVGGIVGYNNGTTTAASINTMIMNCMFYGDITNGEKISPIYGGNTIDNLNSGGLNTFNYYAYDELKTKSIDFYNCALAVEEIYLTRIEFYRLLLNSNKKLAAYYASTATVTVNPGDMAKWVLETANRQIASPMPYPVLKSQGKHPSIINIDAEHAHQLTLVNGRPQEEDRNKGGKIGTLSVTISAPSGWTNKPSDAKLLDESGKEITTTRTITLNRTDKDEARFNFNYDKVQLPYYNDYGTKNYTSNKVVTGWKITDITTISDDPYGAGNYDYTQTYSSNASYFDYPNYNFADRKSSQKDKYSISGRVFSQGAYFDVPYGVTSITIEPYWGNAAYVADEYLDIVGKNSTSGRNTYVTDNVTQLGKNFSTGKITIDGSEQTVFTTISNALNTLSGSTVYDNAVVLVGNLHQGSVPSGGDKAFTMMSVDLDKDNEPDYSLIYYNNDRNTLSPLRFDFLNIPGWAQVQKPNGSSILLNAGIFRTKGWFEITNTALIFFTQYEYENEGIRDTRNVTKSKSPLILLGGYIDQFVSTQNFTVDGKTIYIHVGSNVLINSFGLGTHSDGAHSTPHVPVSVTGGDYKGFYLTGTYNQNATVKDDNAECYISGGRFGELAGAAQEQIGSNNSANNGNIRWQIYDADITDFYGGGINDAKPVQGNITTDIFNSQVATFCGGPKFGNMASNKTVTTTAEGCTFNKFFGAGFGGNSYSRKKYFDNTGPNWNSLQSNYTTDRGKYFNGTSTGLGSNNQYGFKGPGVATDFDYEFFVWTSGAVGGRFFVKFVSFSLAQCNDVESTLKECVIKDNFYGGGSLGKVTGNITSILENCTVKGNVFGAGYSASKPTIDVRNGGFSTVPRFNSDSGMFESGVPSGTTQFEWTTHAFPNNNTKAIDESGTTKYVWTDQILTNENLGSVYGNVTLTLKGNTQVGTMEGEEGAQILKASTGNVYGGGEESAVTGSGNKVTVRLQGNTQVLGNVFGGGNEGLVEGSTEVNIE